jgi:hypothetical protein
LNAQDILHDFTFVNVERSIYISISLYIATAVLLGTQDR